jgi:DnaJ domain
MFGTAMSEVPEAVVAWLERKRRADRATAAVLAVLALGSGTAVFILATAVVYTVLSLVFGAFGGSLSWLGPVALGLTAWAFFRIMKARQKDPLLDLDPTGFWIIKDICSVGPRLINEGIRQVRCCGELGEMNVTACARVLVYLAAQNRAVTWQDLIRHCPQPPWPLLRQQLSLLEGVLFLGDPADKVTLMDPFRLRLRWMLEQQGKPWTWQEATRPRPEPKAQPVPVSDPEKLSAYEILGLSGSASAREIKLAYRKRIKECHPDLFADMDQHAKAQAERWTKALNAAYAALRRGASPL